MLISLISIILPLTSGSAFIGISFLNCQAHDLGAHSVGPAKKHLREKV